MNAESNEIIIECDCGTHMLKVQSEVDNYDGKVIQEIYLAMFYYGIESHKRKWWQRIPIACKYLKTGKMFSDQLCLTPKEAKKLSDFINKNLIE
jgi:hypothetical protein